MENQSWWKSKSKGQKAGFIVSIVCFALFVTLFFIFIYCRQIFGDEVGDNILGPGVANGWALLSKEMFTQPAVWIGTLVVLVVAFSLTFIANFIIFLCSYRGKRRAKTVASLAKSLVKIIIVVASLSAILTIWGVDVSGIITSVGVLTLIVGLGCQTLIQDVISGMFIVFDDYFGVGDVVIIDGFRGTVQDLGLKTTKLVDAGGNIKAISNSSIQTVVNLSRIDSMVTLEMPISYNEDLVRVEGIIVGALDKIKESIPNITEGPYYKGVAGVKDSSVNLFLLCRCKEANRFQVTRDLTREMYLLFRENKVLIPYNQIVVNKEDEPSLLKASDLEKMLSLKANNENRGIGVNKELGNKKNKKSFLKKAIDSSLEETLPIRDDK